jgi:hypothetical protein
MNPAHSKYSMYQAYLSKSRKNNGVIKGLKQIEQEEGAG